MRLSVKTEAGEGALQNARQISSDGILARPGARECRKFNFPASRSPVPRGLRHVFSLLAGRMAYDHPPRTESHENYAPLRFLRAQDWSVAGIQGRPEAVRRLV